MSGRAQLGPTAGGAPVLSPEARALYLEIVKADGRVPSDSPCHRNALTELLEIGLLMPDAGDRSELVAVDPAQLSARLSGAWQRQALDLLSRAVALPVELHELSQEFHAPEKGGGAIEYVQGKVLINQRLDQLFTTGTEETLALQPGGPRPPELLAAMVERDVDALNRGTSMRTIYHASTRYHQPTRDYVAKLATAGGQFRTLDEPYTRLIVIDRRVAVIPVADDMTLAAFIFEPVIANYLVEEVFEPSWNRALEFNGKRAVPQQVVSRLRQTIIDLMLAGINHRVIARRLGISERTLARHIAEMREEYNVESLFQLGYALARAAEHSPG
ncbi:helix-turn-helix domain-containing protein [Kitasatospora sp. SUK 42]|uniref:helix-turn-helix transcriptional regulator n=1 Tax=Kitasatospora sp. SUK 42 TaxID=1588882 RepID=UPI0018C9348F|nr:helix-turn-helix domain-containing protein [Kitasatospora sp. SUK 42]MBV2152914.1 helix-turn-helix domain-containing protein [Kitasatospora sp. SUK 42]